MPLNMESVGRSFGPSETRWSSRDALLYALGVGAGQDDPLRELEFTTENSHEVTQLVLPTFGVIVVQQGGPRQSLGDFNRAMLVHAEQSLTLHRPLPVEGRASITSTLKGIYDKGSGALVVTESTAADAESGEPLLSTVSSAFIRGEGGFGGDRGPSALGSGPRASRTTASARRPGPTRPCSTGSPATATRCTPTPRSPRAPASRVRSSTACARTASRAASCCTRCAARTRRGSGRCARASHVPCCRARSS